VTDVLNSSKAHTVVKDTEEAGLPRRYRVVLLNDHYTTMEFVVQILEQVFLKPHSEAVTIMLAVHRHGSGVAGVYVKQVAETKCAAVHRRARCEGFPLRCVMEPE
jgi:ATP-dependent Clp protease adaptor protein ClpS